MQSDVVNLSELPDPYEQDLELIAEAQRRFEVTMVREQFGPWAVTAFGVECLTEHYPIAKTRLWEGEPDHGWLHHMIGKRNVDLGAFADCLESARVYYAKFCPSHLRRSIPRAKVRRVGLSPKVRFAILKRDGYRCRICGATADSGSRLQVDHITAVANGGSNDARNLWTICFQCNIGKGTQPL